MSKNFPTIGANNSGYLVLMIVFLLPQVVYRVVQMWHRFELTYQGASVLNIVYILLNITHLVTDNGG